MAVMLGKLYNALVDAGASPDKGTQAAEEMAGYENRFAKIERDLDVLKWMVGFNIAMTLALVGRLFLGGH